MGEGQTICEKDPPRPTACYDPGSVPQACAVLRIYNNKGEQVDFRRDCSTLRESGCTSQPDGGKHCATICKTTGCDPNSAHSIVASSTFHISIGLIVALVCRQK